MMRRASSGGTTSKWDRAISPDGKVNSNTVNVIIGVSATVHSGPNTLAYGLPQDLDDVDGRIQSALVFSDPGPYDWDRVGQRRPRSLPGSGFTQSSTDPARVHSAAELIEELWELVDYHPGLKDDPILVAKVMAALDYAYLVSDLLDIVSPEAAEHMIALEGLYLPLDNSLRAQ